MDGLRRLPHGIARELLEQRRRAVRSLGVVGPGSRILEISPFLRRVHVLLRCKLCDAGDLSLFLALSLSLLARLQLSDGGIPGLTQTTEEPQPQTLSVRLGR